MPISPYDFLMKYRHLDVTYVSRSEPAGGTAIDATRQIVTSDIHMTKYFMMKWDEGSSQLKEYNLVTAKAHGGGKRSQSANEWFAENQENIKTAGMGKGSPEDYRLALEWAIISRKIPNPNTTTVQDYCSKHLGLECSGFVTNYLVATGKRPYSANLLRNTNAASYYNPGQAINDINDIQQGDLLVWMNGGHVKTGPGHIAVVDTPPSYSGPTKMRVCEATAHGSANPKILSSFYEILAGTAPGSKHIHNKVLILKLKRHGTVGDHACIIRPI
jgi:hypothetical protein